MRVKKGTDEEEEENPKRNEGESQRIPEYSGETSNVNNNLQLTSGDAGIFLLGLIRHRQRIYTYNIYYI